MKKMLMGLGIVGGLLFTGGASSAATLYYIDYMNDMKPGIQEDISDKFDKDFKETDSKIYHSTIYVAYHEMNRIEKSSNDYLQTKLNTYEQEKMDKNTKAIKSKGSEIEKEMKAYVDELFNKKRLE